MGKFDIEKFPTSESALDMLHSISEDFYEKSYVMKWLLQVMGMEWDDAAGIVVNELTKQFFIETATWGLRYHEEKWRLPVREKLSYEERRKLLYEKRDYNVAMTPYAMERYLEKTVPGIKAYVMDCHDSGEYGYIPQHPNVFLVIILFDRDNEQDLETIKNILDKIKQSHTFYELIFDLPYQTGQHMVSVFQDDEVMDFEQQVI